MTQPISTDQGADPAAVVTGATPQGVGRRAEGQGVTGAAVAVASE